MIMTMIVLYKQAKQQHISMVSRQTVTSVRVQEKAEPNNRSLAMACGSADCCMTGIVSGVRSTKNISQYQFYPIPVNIAQYPIITQY